MSYIVLFILIFGGYVLGAPILRESLQFHIVDCIEGDNETLSKQVLKITDFNETCIRVNQSSSQGNEIYLYMAPQTEDGVQLHITTESCSTPLPDLHLSLCDDIESNENYTQIIAFFAYSNVTDIHSSDDDYNNTSTTETTTETISYTGPTVYETLHHLDLNEDSSEEENNITTEPSVSVQQIDEQSDSSEDENK